MTDADHAIDLPILTNASAQAKSLLHTLEQAARDIVFFVVVWFCFFFANANKMEFMYFKQKEATSTLSGKPLKPVDHFTCLGSNSSSTEYDINIPIPDIDHIEI